MILFVDAICWEGSYTNLPYWQKDVETACEELTSLVAEGWTLQRAVLVDGHSRVELPIVVFDGQSFRKPIKQLQQQWQQLLAQPVASAPQQPVDRFLVEVVQRHMQREEHYIKRLTETIDSLEQMSHQTQRISCNESTRHRIDKQRQTMLSVYKSQLCRVQLTYRRSIDRFKRTTEHR